jgi:hypothetical protein
MPTNRTKRIRETIADLVKQQPSWDSRRLRKSCLDAIGDGDTKERAKLGNSIRRTMTQLLDAGVLLLGENESVSQGPSFDRLLSEISADSENQSEKTKKMKTTPEKEAEGKKPKEKDMRLFLSELFEMGGFSEGEIVEKAVRNFGVKGERIHGVRGLTLQVLKALVSESAISRVGGVYAKVSTSDASKSAPTEKRETTRRATAVKVQRVARSKPRPAVVSVACDAVLDEKSFAALVNQKGGDFFNVLVAKLLETYYASVGVRVSGRFVVDGSEDRGIDVIFHVVDELGFSDKVAVQAKTRARSQIALKELREFYGCAHAEGATKGIFVTTATFTTEAVEFLRKNDNLTGIDAVKLFELACRYEICIRHREGKPYASPELVK